jgi:hypothetical protein
MPAGIGSYNFIAFKGGVNPGTGENLEEITRPNVDGVAYRKIGKKAPPFQMISIADVANDAAATSLLNNYKALQGTLATIELEGGSTYTNVAVLSVEQMERIPVTGSIGGLVEGSTVILKCRWVLQATAYA